VVITLGLFGLAELISMQVQGDRIGTPTAVGGGIRDGLRGYLQNWRLSLRTSGIGVILGFMPGLGAVVDWLAYGHAVQSARDRERFGKGDIRGVIAPEAANNAKEGGAFIPTILFGIPGSGTMALFLAALYVLGVNPGKEMIDSLSGLTLTFTIVWSLAIGNVIATGVMLAFNKPFAKVTTIKSTYIVAILIPLVVIAAFQASGHWGDVVLLVAMGVLGWLMKQWGWPRPPLLIGFILGDLAERYFFISRVRYGYEWLLHPGVLFLGALTVLSIYWGLRITRRVEKDTHS
jgi:putative tricarboxylic transport membrane protein